ncbi:Predicted transcriptional regulators [[Eubacterium] siraeum V10Sc8a]|uniref:Predicted transcriptional regulators n=1 Tax=[Eubacterium] siraeum V10Sc8a TaxID=717961 RepID=D4MLT7_9FIRM|nr:Predicted transcriptional regulators [[Eubacterium] siraeum V10Sc8a]
MTVQLCRLSPKNKTNNKTEVIMDYNKMINIKRETNVNDNAFAMPPNKKITDTDDGGGSYYGNDIGVEIEDDYSYMIENENEDTVKSVKLSKELLSYFLNEIKNIAVSLLEPYHTHTFTVSVTDDFKESINRMGVIEPLLIAQSANYGKYEVISGHRRLEAAKAVGLEKLPCRIAREDTPREILDEIMVITNLQRRNTFTKMELARSLKLLNDSRKRQGYRTDIMNSSGTSTKTELAEEFGISVKKLYMLISFTQLTEYFAKKVDDNTLPDKVAYCLAFLSEYEQHIVEEYLNSNPNYVLTADKAERLKDKKDKDKNLDKRTIDAILSAVRQRKTIETTTVKLNTSTFEKYGLKGKTANEISDILEKALQNYFENEQEIE